MKSLNQIIAGMNVLILCASAVWGKKAGLSPERFLEILSKTSAHSYPLQTKLQDPIDGGLRVADYGPNRPERKILRRNPI